MSPLIRRTEEACRRALEELGFTKRRHRFSIEINQDVVGTVGLNRAVRRRDRVVEINPVVGVLHLPLACRLAEIGGEPKVSRYSAPPTISRHIGYLTPRHKYTPWLFSEKADADGIARHMAEVIHDHGLPFLRQHQKLIDFYDSMVHRRFGGSAERFAYYLPVAALMLGMPGKSSEHIKRYLSNIRGRHDISAENYRKFAGQMFDLLHGNGTGG